ncbi:hypothetical protein V7139_31300, partial [Neobacillus drentensis]|uniref:lectin-like domain-containing protein n=1 Tax=Neobacillus drentensis TaxID=220684 RepID=UPI003B585E08
FYDSQQNSMLNLTGLPSKAKFANGQLVLTENRGNQTGGAFYKEKLALGTDKSFSTFFTFVLSPEGSIPADGLVFVLNNTTNAIGEAGGGIGYQGIQNSIGIEFDTYRNMDRNDPNSNHIGLDVNGSLTSRNVKTLDSITLSDGREKYAWIDYSGASQTLTVSNSNDRNAGESLIVNNINLSEILNSPDVYAGFTAGTGGYREKHAITSFYLDSQYEPIDTGGGDNYIPAPSKVTLTANPATDIYGTTTSQITARVTNVDNTPARNVNVTFSSNFNSNTETV